MNNTKWITQTMALLRDEGILPDASALKWMPAEIVNAGATQPIIEEKYWGVVPLSRMRNHGRSSHPEAVREILLDKISDPMSPRVSQEFTTSLDPYLEFNFGRYIIPRTNGSLIPQGYHSLNKINLRARGEFGNTWFLVGILGEDFCASHYLNSGGLDRTVVDLNISDPKEYISHFVNVSIQINAEIQRARRERQVKPGFFN